ncbi:CDP-glycerol glycerophosphotransferase family protein [Nitrincola alkalilacustris]|uniref:CDP-glycerol glycerophosphotransferase family protein n=1 Tax=Nitrincola alkalilacustris TaxID=1571224 RepID=UPI00124E1D04|nr:CDP-glycerol glycerophosphotransferase family protein [Nitrincola alkalilacustris]
MNWKIFWTFLVYHWYYHAALIATWLIPRSRKIWVVGGSKGLRFADNARHFALQAKRTWPNQKIVWISPSTEVRAQAICAGIPSHHPISLLGIWYCLRASWHIFDTSIKDISEFTGIGAKWLNLWHGVPLKSLDNMKPWPSNNRINRIHNWWYRKDSQYHKKYLTHPTPPHFDYLSEIFDLPRGNIITSNLPRNQQIISSHYPDLSTSELQLRQELAQSKRTVIGYFPTWRDTGMDRFLGAVGINDINALNALLKEHDAILVTKWHSCSYQEYKHRGMSRTAAEIDATLTQSPHIMTLPFQCDLNTILDCCDILISDYSGVMIDYLLLDRPIIQIPYDLDEYRIFTGLLPDYELLSASIGPMTKSFSQLLQQLEQYLLNNGDWQREYKASHEKIKHYYFATIECTVTLEKTLQPV